MTITLRELEAAAFWDQAVCLDCQAISVPEGDEPACPACGSDAVYGADFLLKVQALVKEEE